MGKSYGVALIGCGKMGETHISDIYYKDSANFIYACDLDAEKARSMQKKYNVQKVTKDYKECILSEEVDIVIIATYPSVHLEILKLCVKYGKHVICEKPITANLKDGREFVDIVKKNPKSKVLIGHILRHNNTYQKIAELIQNDAIGKPIIFRMVQNHHTMDWDKYLTLINETSPIIDCGVHYIDVMQWFTNTKVSSVSAIGIRTESDVPENRYNYGLMTIELEDGSVGYYEVGWSNTMSSDNLKEFIGPKGRIQLVYRKDRQTHQEEGDLIEYYKYPEKTYELINLQSKRKPTGGQYDYLIKMIETDCEAKPTIDEVFNSFCICLEADQQILNNNRKKRRKSKSVS